MPEGYHPPEGVEDGEEFQDIATFRLKPGGKMMCVVEVGEGHAPVAGYKPDDAEDYRAGAERRYAEMNQS